MPQSAAHRKAKEHAEQISVVTMDTGATNHDSVEYECESYREQMPDVTLCRDVGGGTKTLRQKGETYLPKHPAEQDDDYARRLNKATAPGAFNRTVGGLTGMIFRKAPAFEGISGDMERDMEDVDLAGHDFATFAQRVEDDAMRDGHTWLMVDHPQVPEGGFKSKAEEMAAGARPYWLQILKSAALNWRYEMVGGVPFLTLFVFREPMMKPKGEFGEDSVDRIRVLRPGTWEVWELQGRGDNKRWVMESTGPTSLSYIPVWPVYTKEVSPYVSCPPLLDMAYLEIEHYQVRSDHRHAQTFASSPMPWFAGTDKESIEWGSNRALFMPSAEATAGLLESSGASLASTREDLKDIEARMAVLGLSMLVRETRAAETAESKRIDKSGEDSALGRMARSLEAALQTGLNIHADYRKTSPPTVTVNRDFIDTPMDPQRITMLSTMVEKRQLSLDQMWLELKAGEVLGEDFDPDEERERLMNADRDDLG